MKEPEQAEIEMNSGTHASEATKPWRAGLITGLMMLLTAIISGSVLYNLSLDSIRSEVRDNLVRTAASASITVDADAHAQFHSPSQETERSYMDAIQPLERIRVAAGDIKFIYTCVLISNRVHFVLDPTPAGDADKDGTDDKSHIMQVYEEPSPELVKVLQTGKASADQQPYTDAWGTFVSGYSPFLNSRGEVAGVVGVDLDASKYVQRLASMKHAAWAGVGTALILSIIAGLGFYRLQSRINEFRRQIQELNADLEFKVIERTAQLNASKQLLEEEAAERRRSEREAVKAQRVAEAANRSKGEFLATMTHELRTPMNGVVGMANVLLGTPLDADQTECVEIIRTSGESLLGIVDNILDFSMLEGEELGMEVVPYDPRKVVEEAVSMFSDRARERKLALNMRVADDLPGQLVSDAARVRQVLMNLISNAVKFTETGSITVEARAMDQACDALSGESCSNPMMLEFVRFSVTDTGIGIPEDKQRQLFQQFTQGDGTASRKHGGIGLGLALCKRLVNLMGGQIGATSQPGCGSTFWFTLPVGACAVPLHLRNAQSARQESKTLAP